jgi:hypothetical protein
MAIDVGFDGVELVIVQVIEPVDYVRFDGFPIRLGNGLCSQLLGLVKALADSFKVHRDLMCRFRSSKVRGQGLLIRVPVDLGLDDSLDLSVDLCGLLKLLEGFVEAGLFKGGVNFVVFEVSSHISGLNAVPCFDHVVCKMVSGVLTSRSPT